MRIRQAFLKIGGGGGGGVAFVIWIILNRSFPGSDEYNFFTQTFTKIRRYLYRFSQAVHRHSKAFSLVHEFERLVSKN